MSSNTTFIKAPTIPRNTRFYRWLYFARSQPPPHILWLQFDRYPSRYLPTKFPAAYRCCSFHKVRLFLHSYHFNILILNISSAPTGQVQFQVNETQVILNQAYENTIGGFVPNSNQPDPNWGKCLQCAVVDRSRLNVRPTIERSAFCTKCFTQYCYNPAKLTSSAELPNRQLDYAGPSTISV